MSHLNNLARLQAQCAAQPGLSAVISCIMQQQPGLPEFYVQVRGSRGGRGVGACPYALCSSAQCRDVQQRASHAPPMSPAAYTPRLHAPPRKMGYRLPLP